MAASASDLRCKVARARRRLDRFRAQGGRRQRLLARAWCMLGYYRLALWVGSFRRRVAALQHQRQATPAAPLSGEQAAEAAELGALVAIAARYTPWRSSCLVQVLALQHLLAARAIPGQFYLGVRLGQADQPPGALGAHAWLQCGEAVVCGEPARRGYRVISVYRWPLAH